MARRRLLSDEHWAGLFALPADERDVVRHCTLTPDDLALIGVKRSAAQPARLTRCCCARSAIPAVRWTSARCRPSRWSPTSRGQLGVDPAALAAYHRPPPDPARAARRADAPWRLPELRAGGGPRPRRLADSRGADRPHAGRARRHADRRASPPTHPAADAPGAGAGDPRCARPRRAGRAPGVDRGDGREQVGRARPAADARCPAPGRRASPGCAARPARPRRATCTAWSSACVPCGRSASSGAAKPRCRRSASTRSPARACA